MDQVDEKELYRKEIVKMIQKIENPIILKRHMAKEI